MGCSVVYLTLVADGTFQTEVSGLASGNSQGKWRLSGSHITFEFPKELDFGTSLVSYSAPLEVLRVGGDWALLSSAQADRKYYEEYGVTRDVCFVTRKKAAK